MKSFKYLLTLSSLVGLLFISCSEKSSSPIESSAINLDKKGPVVHRVNGSVLLRFEDKITGGRFTAKEYADGSYDGEYEINGANALGDPTFKWNGDVLSLKVYENAGPYGGVMGVIGGVEKTGPYAGWYDVIFVVDNGEPGQSTYPDEGIWVIYMTLDLTQAQGWWNMDPNSLINMCGIVDAESGNVTVE
jgi:hypothetical protein